MEKARHEAMMSILRVARITYNDYFYRDPAMLPEMMGHVNKQWKLFCRVEGIPINKRVASIKQGEMAYKTTRG